MSLLVAKAQEQIDLSPILNQTYFQYTKNNLNNVAIGDPAPNQQWDFSNLKALVVERIQLDRQLESDASKIFISSDFVKHFPGMDCFYNQKGGSVSMLGYKGLDPLGFGTSKTVVFETPLQIVQFPLNYGESYEGSTQFEILLESHEIPADIIKVLPVTPSKMKIEYSEKYIADIDATGNLILPESHHHDVLRERRFRTVQTKVKIKLGFFSWIDVSSLYSDFEGLGLGKEEKIVDHFFWTSSHTFPVLRLLQVEGTSCKKAVFHSEVQTVRETELVSDGLPHFEAMPNPAISSVEFQLLDLEKGRYTLRLMNIIGQTIWEKPLYFTTNTSIKLDLDRYPKGTYLYVLEDEFGKTVSSKRLIIIKP